MAIRDSKLTGAAMPIVSTMDGMSIRLRKAAISDVDQIFAMLQSSAVEQGFPDELAVTEEDLRQDGFGLNPRFEVVIAEADGVAVGMALYFFTYSTWISRMGLYLEDLYVRPEYRRNGVAGALMKHLAQVARERGRRFQWVVHRGNARATAFYETLGARTLDDWTLMSIKGAALDAL